jgi:aldose 1-epimerase
MKKHWGLSDEQDVFLYTLENERLRVEISDYGAIIRSLFVKDFGRDVVLGYSDLTDYIADDKYVGAVIGRNANRIALGKFTLNAKTYQLNINNPPNHLHGGNYGFNKRVFEVISHSSDSLILNYMSPHKEEGYPGNLDFTVAFRLENDTLLINYRGVSDQKTLFNPTHHSYFNLSGEDSIVNHDLSIDSDFYAPIDKDGLALYPPVKVSGAMDFKRYARISQSLESDMETLRIAKGLDHHFERKCDDHHPFIRLRYGLFNLSVLTDSPGVQIYSGNYLDGKSIGKDGRRIDKFSGICFETQFYPDNINNASKTKGILDAFQTQTFTTQWRFYRKEESVHE